MVILINLLLLRKDVDPYEYMDSWKRFNETSLPFKNYFYSEVTHMGDYHNLNVQTDTLLLPDVFEKFREKCIEICGLDPSHFYSAPGLAWQACLKKKEVKLELLTDIDVIDG